MTRLQQSLLFVFCVSLPVFASAQESDVVLRATTTSMNDFEPGTWSVLAIDATNRGEQDAEGSVAIFFNENQHVQYQRSLWVPANSSRRTWLPIQIPRIQGTRQSLRYSSMDFSTQDGREVLKDRQYEELIRTGVLTVDESPVKTGMILPRKDPGEDPTFDEMRLKLETAEKLVLEGRSLSGLSARTTTFARDLAPPLARAYESLDQLVVADNRLLDDSGGLAAIRQWLEGGGRLWITLDTVKMELAETLLGNAVGFQVIDRVELTDFTLETFDAQTQEWKSETWSSEFPVDFVRVETDLTDISCRVNGNPMAFWQQVGNGEILFTTLSPPGWFTQPGRMERILQTPKSRLNALDVLSPRFFQAKNEARLALDELKPALQEQIGYRIPSRWIATSVLSLNCLGLLAAAIVLGRSGRLELMAWILPAITVGSAILLAGIGLANARGVPSMIATMQLLQVGSDGQQADASGIGGIYAQNSTPLTLGTTGFGLAMPELNAQRAETRRLEWDDEGGSRWANLSTQPGSVAFVTLHQTRQLETPLTVRGHFRADGFSGHIQGFTGELQESVIVSPPARNLSVSIESDGEFQSGVDSILPQGQYLPDTFLSDDQRRRQLVYRSLLTSTSEGRYPTRPTLFAWGTSRDLGLELPKGYQQVGGTLLALPILFDRTPGKTSFQVPSTFVRVESAVGRHGTSTAFDPRMGEWLQLMTSTKTTLRFALPSSVLPCKITKAELTLRIIAPSRTLTLNYPTSDDDVLIQEFKNPSGVLNVTIEDPAALQLDETGGLLYGFFVSNIEDRDRGGDSQANNNTWQIDYVRMDIFGETL